MTYAAKLKDPRWQKKRLESLQAAEWACAMCGDSSETLHVHHKQYISGRDPWEYDLDQLAVLCETCHSESHQSDDLLIDVISRLPTLGPIDRDVAAKVIAGMSGQDIDCKYGIIWWHLGHIARNLACIGVDDLRNLQELFRTAPPGFGFGLEIANHLDAIVANCEAHLGKSVTKNA